MTDKYYDIATALARRWDEHIAPNHVIDFRANIAYAIRTAVEAEREACAEIAALHAERIKHTSHRDGLGMGSQCCEQECDVIAAAIRSKADG